MVILATKNRELGTAPLRKANCSFDANGDKAFSIKIARRYWTEEMTFGNMAYIPDTEFGGIIGEVLTSTTLDYVELKGHTWRGRLEHKIISPPPGSDVNVLRNMSVSCDCEGCAAAPVVTPNIGIVASVDILAADQASVDLVYALKEEDHKDLVERMETRHGLRQLSYMKELQMGNDRYILIDIDNDDARICPKEAVKDVKPFEG